ncbi:MAG: hypothetical protein P8107_14820 [Spirochaetia bacterium]
MRLSLSVITVLFFGLLVSCRSAQINNNTALRVTFSDYQKDATTYYLTDKDMNDYEEVYDTVLMKIVSEGVWKGKSFQIQLSENPVRKQFQKVGTEFDILIDENYLIELENNPSQQFILSGEIDFR